MTTTIRILTTSTLDSSPSVLLTSLINCGGGDNVDVVGVGSGVGRGVGGGDGGGDSDGKLNDKSIVPNATKTVAAGAAGAGGAGGGVAVPGSLKISNVHSICLTHLGFDTVGGN